MTEKDVLLDLIKEVMAVTEGADMSDDTKFRQYLEASDYYEIRKLPDGAWVGLTDMLFTTALCIRLDRFGYDKRYCYRDPNMALAEIEKLENGDQEPEGWIRRLPK
jgi:hypothetical protein